MTIELFILIGILIGAFSMLAAKHLSSLIGSFRSQSLLICFITFIEAYKSSSMELYFVTALIFVLKAVIIPFILIKIIKEIKSDESMGFYINSQFSLLIGLFLTAMSWYFSGLLFLNQDMGLKIFGTVSFSIVLFGMFIMITRLKAITQVIGLLVMENGLFILASSISGGMPFIVEMAVFFDVFVSVMILGVFIYRINNLFISIDVDKLNSLKG